MAGSAAVGLTPSSGPLARGCDPGAAVLSPTLRIADAGFALYVRGGASLLQCRWLAVAGRARVCRVRWGGAVPRVHEGVFPVSARGGPGPWGVLHTPHKGAAKGTEDFVHKGRVCDWAFVSVRMVGCSCSPSASARIWWIAKMGHRFGAVGVSAVRSRWGRASSCCQPSRWNLHVADHTLVCGQRRRVHR